MPSLAVLVTIFAVAAVLYGLGRAVLAAVAQAGGSAERARTKEREISQLRRQSEIMLEEKDPENVATDLDSGVF